MEVSIDQSTLKKFEEVAKDAFAKRHLLSNGIRLQLYGLYKVATEGPCSSVHKLRLLSPGWRDKLVAWEEASALSQQRAAERYLDLVASVLEPLEAVLGGSKEGEPNPEALSKLLKERNEELLRKAAVMAEEVELLKKAGGVEMRGWLWRRRSAVYWGEAKWVRSYLVLRSRLLLCYRNEEDASPYYSFALDKCVVRDEGMRGQGNRTFHSFALFLKGGDTFTRGPNSGALIRLSTDKDSEAFTWMELLRQACAEEEDDEEQEINASGATSPTSPLLSRSNSIENMLEEKDLPLPQLNKMLSQRGSAANLKAIKKIEKKKPTAFTFPASRPMHKGVKHSLLSSESQNQNYRGFFNLGVIILIVTNSRLIIDNMLKYGLLLGFPTEESLHSINLVHWPCTEGFLLMQVHLALTLQVERAAAKEIFSETVAILLNSLNIAAQLGVATWLVWSFPVTSIAGLLFMLASVTLWMKLVSYVHVNRDLRLADRERQAVDKTLDNQTRKVEAEDEELLNYPDNLTWGNLYYFWFAPTLSYQLNYPRVKKVRQANVLTLLARILIFSAITIFISTQYMLPAAANSVKYVENGDYVRLFERILIMAVPSTYIWLLGFYVFFHLYLNLLAELLQFGDREFYKDWWNSTSFEAYWRLWNLPVHHWIVRHAYFPVLRMGFSKNFATMWVFFLSAVLHELVISVPFKMVRLYAFLGMMGQIPLVIATKALEKAVSKQSQVGNVLFWVIFCIFGQPMALLMYYIDFCRSSEQISGSTV